MRKIFTILLLSTVVTHTSVADHGDNGVRSKKLNSKKIVEKLTTLQSTWRFEPLANLQQISFVKSIDNNMPAFVTEEEQMDFIRTHKKLVMLNWLVAEPKAEATYIIERGSYDYDDFIEIGRIEPSQRNIAVLTNFFMDTDAPIGLFQYRVTEVLDCQATAHFTPQTTTKFIDNPTAISLKASLN